MKLVLREYQNEAVASIWSYFAVKYGNPCLALPTGTGKSLVIAALLESIFKQYGNQKILCLTHVKELIVQNCQELLDLWPTAPAGIYSSGLKQHDVHSAIIFGGIASVAKHAEEFGKVQLVIIDEAHLVSPKEETMYQKFLNTLRIRNPLLKVIGLTATPWRAGQGPITEDGIFTDVCYDITGMEAFNKLIKDGYLAPLIPLRTELLLDVSGVHKLGGEFKANELQLAVDKDKITFAALTESIAHGANRKHWLIFAAGIDHAINIANMLEHMGISCKAVHSKMPDKERDAAIADFKAGRIRAIVNNGILTTGFNFPAIDMIIMLRPTASTVLWIQMLGRGTRPCAPTGKRNCLVLDFAGNTKRLGPINDPVIPKAKGKGPPGEAPVRICDVCGMYNHASARFCGGKAKTDPEFTGAEGCGMPFLFTPKIQAVASSAVLIKEDFPIVEIIAVESVTYAIHNKVNRPPSLRVSYFSKFHKFTEYIHFELPGFGQRKAAEWWSDRALGKLPITTSEALGIAQNNMLSVPTHLRVWINKPYPEIMAVSFDGPFVKLAENEIPF
jgi:DNA repair protein RadD